MEVITIIVVSSIVIVTLLVASTVMLAVEKEAGRSINPQIYLGLFTPWMILLCIPDILIQKMGLELYEAYRFLIWAHYILIIIESALLAKWLTKRGLAKLELGKAAEQSTTAP